MQSESPCSNSPTGQLGSERTQVARLLATAILRFKSRRSTSKISLEIPLKPLAISPETSVSVTSGLQTESPRE